MDRSRRSASLSNALHPHLRRAALSLVLLALLSAGCGGRGGGGGGSSQDDSGATSARYTIRKVEVLGELRTVGDANAEGIAVAAGPLEENPQDSERSFLWEESATHDLGNFAARALNNAGDLAGEEDGVAWLWTADREKKALAYGIAHGLNDRRSVVGEAYTTGGHLRAFLWAEGILKDLGTLGGNNSVAYSVNDLGQVAGWAEDEQGALRACLWEDGSAIDLGTLGGDRSMAYSINERGKVVGYASTAKGVDHAFVAGKDSPMKDLGSLGGYSVAYDIDGLGRVVGESLTTTDRVHAFLWADGRMLDLNELLPEGSDWELVRATVVSDAGLIYGEGRLQGEERAFRLTLDTAGAETR